jgi:hypothetical protein
VWWLTGTSRVPRIAFSDPGIAKKITKEYQLSFRISIFFNLSQKYVFLTKQEL